MGRKKISLPGLVNSEGTDPRLGVDLSRSLDDEVPS